MKCPLKGALYAVNNIIVLEIQIRCNSLRGPDRI